MDFHTYNGSEFNKYCAGSVCIDWNKQLPPAGILSIKSNFPWLGTTANPLQAADRKFFFLRSGRKILSASACFIFNVGTVIIKFVAWFFFSFRADILSTRFTIGALRVFAANSFVWVFPWVAAPLAHEIRAVACSRTAEAICERPMVGVGCVICGSEYDY